MSTINNISINQPVTPPAMPSVPNVGDQASGPSFKDVLVDSIKQVNSMQMQADQAVDTLFSGGDVNPAEVLTAVQKADLAFRLTMQMRNKLMDVYQEIKDIRI
ncbi:MAG TPA: flagellar hook-basal body complex protein FliE [Lacipirellulaceae bacterium]|nr:flagellar hook-basal body complex protein FliE [Lacipirellulaceae bacterium]